MLKYVEGAMPSLRTMMLTGKNRLFIIAAKALFQQAIMDYASKLPEPTKGNTALSLTHDLLEARERFFQDNPDVPKRPMVESAWKILIDEVEHNAEYYPYWDNLLEIIGGIKCRN